jgi:ATP-dependent DNA ligase
MRVPLPMMAVPSTTLPVGADWTSLRSTLTWVRPAVVAEIAFTEWTRDANLRHAAFVALREDKAPKDVRRET